MKTSLLNQLVEAVDGLNQVPDWIRQQATVFVFSGLAQVDGQVVADPTAQGAPGNFIVDFLSQPINLILVSAILFMFIVARPQQKKLKEQQKALSGLKKNDRVVTSSGIHGVVVQTGTDDGLVTIRIDENSGARMTLNRDCIAKITPADSKE